MLDRELDPLATTDVRLCPPHLEAEIDGLNALLCDRVNDGVYKAGFATVQDVYEEMVRGSSKRSTSWTSAWRAAGSCSGP